MDGAAPSTITNRMASVVVPNRMIANGNHAIDGMVCSAVISEPTAARSGLIRDTSAPTSTPMTMASPKPITARRRVVPTACHSRVVCSNDPRSEKTAAGPGRMSFFQPLRWMSSQMPMTIAIASSLGHTAAQIFRARSPAESLACRSSRLSSPASAAVSVSAVVASPAGPGLLPMADHLLAQAVGDRGGQAGDLWRVDPARAADRHTELVDDPSRAAAQHDHPVAQPDRLPHVVRDEQHGEATLGTDLVELVVQQVPGHRVERPERLVHQQDLRVLGERPGQGGPLPHASRQLVRPLAAE